MLPKRAEKNYLSILIEKKQIMKYTNLQVEQMTSFIIFESAHINITPCVNLDTGGENIHTVLLSQFTEEYQRRPEVY